MLTFPPDSSFVIQIVLFLALWFGLKRLLFDPFQQVLVTREARTSGTTHAAAQMRQAANLAKQEYERRMHAVRQTLAAEAAAAHAAAQAAEQEVLTAARQQASAQLAELRDNLNQQAAAARSALAAEARGLAANLFERVVGRPLV
jgi:F-type H+-transporting ATPase subunit b